MTPTTHLITGVAGQDGVLLARLLLAEGGRVVGTVRPDSPSLARNACYLDGVEIHTVDLRDSVAMEALVRSVEPDEIYNLAALSSVGESWRDPTTAQAINGEAAIDLIRLASTMPGVRILQAGSAEEGLDSPYATAKSAASEAVHAARDAGAFASVATLHPHESPLRARSFVSRKVTRAAAEIAAGMTDSLTLGKLDVRRDWGSAMDHVRALRTIIRLDEPRDFVVATGTTHSLRDLLDAAFAAAGLSDPMRYVHTDPSLVRPNDAPELIGDPSELIAATDWRPTMTFERTISEMVAIDARRVSTGVEESASYLEGDRCAS